MFRLTVRLMADRLRVNDNQQSHIQPQIQPPVGRTTVQIKNPPATAEMPAPRTSAFPVSGRPTKATAEDNED